MRARQKPQNTENETQLREEEENEEEEEEETQIMTSALHPGSEGVLRCCTRNGCVAQHVWAKSTIACGQHVGWVFQVDVCQRNWIWCIEAALKQLRCVCFCNVSCTARLVLCSSLRSLLKYCGLGPLRNTAGSKAASEPIGDHQW